MRGKGKAHKGNCLHDVFLILVENHVHPGEEPRCTKYFEHKGKECRKEVGKWMHTESPL